MGQIPRPALPPKQDVGESAKYEGFRAESVIFRTLGKIFILHGAAKPRYSCSRRNASPLVVADRPLTASPSGFTVSTPYAVGI
jgi:hypothetical protein